MDKGKLMLVDGNSILNRAFYGLQGQKLLATSDGLYTNAVFGFLNILHKYLEEEKPEYLCVAFDLKAPTFRHKEFEGYKAKRKGMPEELAVQVPVIKEVLDAMNITRLEYEGFEADDIIGTVSLCAENQGLDVIIITGDRDSLQLSSKSTRIKIPTTRGGKTETDEYDPAVILERYGVTPAQLIEVKGLMGDQSDNIPGVPGVGEKTALDLIIKYGSITKLYDQLECVEKKGVREKLEANKELAFTSRRLSEIDRSIPGLCAADVEQYRRREFDRQKLYDLFNRLEFRSFIDKFRLEPAPSVEAKRAAVCVKCVDSIEMLAETAGNIAAAGEFAIAYLMDKVSAFDYTLVGAALSWAEGCGVYAGFGDRIREEDFLRVFKPVLEDPGIKKYGHDLKSLLVYLKQRSVNLAGLDFDTMIGAYIINPSKDTYTVAELAREHLGLSVESMENLTGKGRSFVPFRDLPVEALSVAAVLHSETVFRLRKVLDSIISDNGQETLYYDIELPLVEVLADMEYQGFKVNLEDLRAFSIELEGRISDLTADIYELAGEEFNINSTKQLGSILFEKLELPVIKKTKTGYSTDAEVLEELSEKHLIVSKILEYRQLVKLKSTYVEGLISVINPETGRIHSSFNQTVTATGRISSTEPNLQNIPIKLEMGREIRKLFVPRDSCHLLADADYSQIELRVLAHITGDENLISAFINNEDIHTSTASRVFDIPKDEVTQVMRSRAKAVNFGIVYGIGDFSLAKDLGITRKEARKYIDEYLDNYPEVRKYMHDTVEYGRKFGFVLTLFNRRRYVPEIKASNFNVRSFGERVAMNTPIQGSAADIIKIAMVKVYRELKSNNLKSRLILQVHDELIIDTLLEEKDRVAEIMKDCMEKAVLLRVPLSVEVKTGCSWYETK